MKELLGHLIHFRDSEGRKHIGKLNGISENGIYIRILTLDGKIEFYSIYGIYNVVDLGSDPTEEIKKNLKKYRRLLIDS